jgi:hypothetical protein
MDEVVKQIKFMFLLLMGYNKLQWLLTTLHTLTQTAKTQKYSQPILQTYRKKNGQADGKKARWGCTGGVYTGGGQLCRIVVRIVREIGQQSVDVGPRGCAVSP